MSTQAGPIKESNRILSLDVARGFALLGIFLVNISLMAAPLGELTYNAPMPEEGALSQTIFYAVRTFFEGKTYPLFSMLFGIGLAMQFMRSREKGTGYYPRIIRRQIALILIGLAHVILLWYGDILFTYGIVGLITLACIRLPARWLTAIAGICLALAVISGVGMSALGAYGIEQTQRQAQTEAVQQPETVLEKSTTETKSESLTPFAKLMKGFAENEVQDPKDPIWQDNEIIATRDGPFTQALLFRLMAWIGVIIFGMALAGGFFHILAIFLNGAAIWKADILGPKHAALRKKLTILFGIIGIPASAYIATFNIIHPNASPYLSAVVPIAVYVFGPIVSLFYLFGIASIVDMGILKPLQNAFANAGRLALTNYLSQTFLASILFAFWGLGMFGSVDRPMRMVIVLSIFILQIAFSALWLKAFKIGPLEWLLRTITYLKPQQIRRTPTQTD